MYKAFAFVSGVVMAAALSSCAVGGRVSAVRALPSDSQATITRLPPIGDEPAYLMLSNNFIQDESSNIHAMGVFCATQSRSRGCIVYLTSVRDAGGMYRCAEWTTDGVTETMCASGDPTVEKWGNGRFYEVVSHGVSRAWLERVCLSNTVTLRMTGGGGQGDMMTLSLRNQQGVCALLSELDSSHAP